MKKSPVISICTLSLSLLALAGCASGPAPAKIQAKAAKQRTVLTKVPVLAKEVTHYADGLVDEYVVYKLDEARKAPMEKDRFDASRADPIERLVLEYKDGREAAESLYESDGKLRSRRELGYNAAGRLVSERLVDAKGALLSGSAYAYDAKGRKTEWRALDASGAAKAVTSYIYGAEGLASVEMRDSAGAATGAIELEYAEGRLAKRSYLGAGGELQKYEAYSYAGARLASLEARRADGSLVSRTAYEYGSLGELAKATEYLPSGAAGSYTTYEYVVREDSSTENYSE